MEALGRPQRQQAGAKPYGRVAQAVLAEVAGVAITLQHAGRPYGALDCIQWHSLATFKNLNAASMALAEKEAAMHARCGLNAWDDHFCLVDAWGQPLDPCEPVWPLRRLLKMLRDNEGHGNVHHPAGDGPFKLADGTDLWPELRRAGDGLRHIGLWGYARRAGMQLVRVYPGAA